MIKIGICGHFGGDNNFLDGQTIKTKIITQELKKIYTVKTLDTFKSKKRMFNILFGLIILLIKCENIIILPAHNGLKIIAPFLTFFNKIFKRKLHYIVIGGWLPKYLEDKEKLRRTLKKFDYIYVETSTMKNFLEKQGFKNITIMPNCKNLKILKEEELIYNMNMPYKLCTFSRVMKEKGIEDAIQAVKLINQKFEKIIYTLDIYGQIDENYKERFEKLVNEFPEYIKYKGIVPFNESADTLKKYYVLLFPTRFYTEGIPGTIIDAYAAGIPVVSSRWESFTDIIEENIIGKGYRFENTKEFIELLCTIQTLDVMNKMKINCLRKAEEYLPKNVINVLFKNLNI